MPNYELRECLKHGLQKFRPEIKRPTKYRCVKCSSEAVSKRRMIIKEMAVRYKGGECVKCGYNKCIGALEFHHVDRTQKDFNISHKGYTRSWEKVKEELDKCELVCANCHREIEYGFARIEVPIRYNKVTYCLVCNAETNNDKFCSRACKGKYSRKCVRPTKEELAQLIIQHTYITIGKMYGVSDRAVKKWVDVYGL